jgi:HK97 family phage portal protein
MTIASSIRNFMGAMVPGIRQAKASATQLIVSMQSLGRPVWTPRRYDKFAQEGYQKNIIVYKAIRELLLAAEQAPWFVQRLVAGQWKEDEMNPLAALLKRPNPQQSGPVFFGSLMGFYSIAGNAYMEKVRPSPGRAPKELYALRPDRMKVIPGPSGPDGYIYTVNGGEKKWVGEDAGDIRHLKDFNPLDDWYGQSPMEAAAFDIDIHNAALEWNKALLDNGCRPSGALIYEPKTESAPAMLSDESFLKLKQQIDDLYSGKSNAGRPLLLEGWLKWVNFMLSPADMDFINSKNTSARDICAAWGVPPQLLGIPGDNTFCLPGYSRISTPTGPVNIEDIRQGAEVWSLSDGELVRRRVVWQGLVGAKRLYAVKTRNRTLHATGNHPVLVRRSEIVEAPMVDSRNSEELRYWLEYVPVEELKEGDVLVQLGECPVDEKEAKVTEREAELLGFYVGDGYLVKPVNIGDQKGYKRGGRINLAIPDGAPYADHYKELLQEFTGNHVAQYDRHVQSCGNDAVRRLELLGFSGTARNKRVPSWMFSQPIKIRLAFLRGIIDSDGSVNKLGGMGLSLCNEDLIKDIWHLALSCGAQVSNVRGYVREMTLPDKSKFVATYYSMNITSADDVFRIGSHTPIYQERAAENCDGKKRSALLSTGGESAAEKIARLAPIGTMHFSKVKSVDPLWEAPVYDIEVEEDHNFIADGIVVHNSNLKEARLAFWEQTVIPILTIIRDELNVWLAPEFGDYRIVLDEDDIPALSPRREELWARLEKATDLTINEKRIAKGYSPIKGGDQLYISATLIPIGSSPFGEAPPPAGENE